MSSVSMGQEAIGRAVSPPPVIPAGRPATAAAAGPGGSRAAGGGGSLTERKSRSLGRSGWLGTLVAATLGAGIAFVAMRALQGPLSPGSGPPAGGRRAAGVDPIGESRRNAIVQAAEVVGPAVVSITAIEKGWDELLRLAASIRSGRITASLALQRFGSAAQGDPLHRAAEHLGRLLRTVFLCDYIAIEDFRREIHTLLNRGESVHQLQRAVYSGKVAAERGRRRDEMRAISGSHALLTNIVLAWNTRRMHDVVERLKRTGTKIEDDWLRRIGPAHFSHINFRGTLKFGVEKYADALVERRSGQPTDSAAG